MAKNYKTRPVSVRDLWIRFGRTGDVETRNELIRQYSYLVRCIAIKIVGHYQYFNYLDDIISEGLIALMDAVAKFDVMKNVKFETFASIKIRGAMIDYIRRQDCFPRRLKKLAKTINDADETLNQRLSRRPTEREIAEYLQVGLPEYEKILAETCSMNILSFEELIYEKGAENLALHSFNSVDGPEQAIARKELKSVLQQDIELLEDKEKIVISLYYKEQLKIKEIAKVMGISESRVSQIHSSALRKLKRSLESYLKQ